MKNFIYYSIIIAISLLSYFYFNSSEQNIFITEIENYRFNQKKELIATEIIKKNNTLHFYQPNNKYQLPIKRQPLKKTNTVPTYHKSNSDIYALAIEKITFELNNKSFELTVFKTQDGTKIIPFADSTNHSTSSKYGRILPYTPSTNHATIDFNLAFNPACEYATKFDCLKIPKSNFIPFFITAGEKRFQD
jgi:uncharacterized protein (DUF1684 family)